MKKLVSLATATLLALSLAACGQGSDSEVSVQSVAMICGYGPLGSVDRFAGVVKAKQQVEIEKQEEQPIDKIEVKEGDSVSKGDVLFSYDSEASKLELEKAKLEVEQMKNTMKNKETEKAALERDRQKASADAKITYSLEIQELEADIAEAKYNIALKEKEVKKMEETVKDLDVKSPVDGFVISVNENQQSDEYGNPKPFMVLSESGNYRVMGYVNENNVGAISEGSPVLIRSRVDADTTWSGVIESIDWEHAVQSGNNMYGDVSAEDEVVKSSKYPFYVEIENIEGLLMGQHVFIEPDFGQGEEAPTINISSWYINDIETDPWVWAEGEGGKLEIRHVALGEYDPDLETYEICDGLELTDYIAFPDDSFKEGMKCSEYSEEAFGGEGEYVEGGEGEEGEYYEGEEGMYGDAEGEIMEDEPVVVE